MTEQLSISSFEEFHNIVINEDPLSAVYRGHSNESYKLIPSVGRLEPYRNKPLSNIESESFNKFKKRAINYINARLADNWEWLSLAQHHGLPTRLLDWTRNPLVALFFACKDTAEEADRAVWVLHDLELVKIGNHPNPLKIDNIYRYSPNHVASRLKVQSGIFTVHPNPIEPLNKSTNLKKIVIKNSAAIEIRSQLSLYGINYETMYADLDGLCNHIKWLRYKNSRNN